MVQAPSADSRSFSRSRCVDNSTVPVLPGSDAAVIRPKLGGYRGVALAVPGQGVRERLVETMIAMKRLSDEEIDRIS